VLVNNKRISATANITFGSSPQITITCTTVNSPVISLRIVNLRNNNSLPLVPSKPTAPNPIQFCSNDVCATTVNVILTPGYARFNTVKQIACIAENKTNPFDLYSQITYNLDFNSKFQLVFFIIIFNLIEI
jgi:hypothetical protein